MMTMGKLLLEVAADVVGVGGVMTFAFALWLGADVLII